MPKPHATQRALLSFYACALFLNTVRTEHEINLCRAPYELVKTLLVLMTDVISEGSGEHVCLHNLVRVSLTINEVSSQIKILDIYDVVFKILVNGFLSTCNNDYSYQS